MFSRLKNLYRKTDINNSEVLTVALIGGGLRGMVYTDVMKDYPQKFKVVAVAEPDEGRRRKLQKTHKIPDDMCFGSWTDILSKEKLADIAMICTTDNMHYKPTMKAIEKGYDIVLEKPVAPTAEECTDIVLAAKEKGVKILVCHVLRYTAFFKKIKALLMEGAIGEVMSVIHVEAVGNVHQSHSYVRGNWHSEEESTPMLLAKCCHDIDILQWLIDKPCKRVQSFGELTYFRSENAPEGAPLRCIDGGCPIENTCPYNCKKLYYYSKDNSWFRPACASGIAKAHVPTDEEIMTALKTTDYGLCVFHANNNVVDHQVVNMEFEGGKTVSLTMNAFNEGGRYIRIFGTKGELYANMSDSKISLYTFDDQKHHKVRVNDRGRIAVDGHGGGDQGMINEMYDYFKGNYKGFCAADIDISVKNHLIGFAAEKARKSGTVQSIDEFFKEYKMENDR